MSVTLCHVALRGHWAAQTHCGFVKPQCAFRIQREGAFAEGVRNSAGALKFLTVKLACIATDRDARSVHIVMGF